MEVVVDFSQILVVIDIEKDLNFEKSIKVGDS